MQHQQLWQLAMRPFVKVIIPINYYQRYQIQIQLLWTSTGSGSFDNVNVEDPIYTLSPGDKTSGSVSFTVTASQPGCAADSDTMVLTIQKNPIANAGTSLQICEGESVTISSASAQFSNSTNWTQSGGLGTFINTSSLSPTYNSSHG